MPEPNVHGETIVYRLFDVGYAIHLDQASALLSSSSPERLRPVRGGARRGFHLMGRRFSRLLADLHTRVADATKMVERVENSLKVTDDVFLARIYAGALELFRGKTWRNGIDRKVTIVRETYDMLNAESQSRRSEVLEIIVVLLIAFEIALALLRH